VFLAAGAIVAAAAVSALYWSQADVTQIAPVQEVIAAERVAPGPPRAQPLAPTAPETVLLEPVAREPAPREPNVERPRPPAEQPPKRAETAAEPAREREAAPAPALSVEAHTDQLIRRAMQLMSSVPSTAARHGEIVALVSDLNMLRGSPRIALEREKADQLAARLRDLERELGSKGAP
jgi:hypothetical protein